MMGHTPGPWRRRDSAKSAHITVTHGNPSVWTAPRICKVFHSKHCNANANATLIAAAPEMLEACEEICAWCEKLGRDNMRGWGKLQPDSANWRDGVGPLELRMYDQAHAAIAKARGECGGEETGE